MIYEQRLAADITTDCVVSVRVLTQYLSRYASRMSAIRGTGTICIAIVARIVFIFIHDHLFMN